MPTVSRGRALGYVAVLLALLVVGGRLALAGDGDPDPVAEQRAEAVVQADPAPERTLLVHVVGAVHRPGLYRLRDGSRVDDAIRRAGGAKPKAELLLVNLAAPVADGQQVVVPVRGAAAAVTPAGGATAVPGASGGTVHLNSATLEELETLPGVGPVTVQRILEYRTANGAFSSVGELDAVPGIGPARLEQLEPLVDL
jgi:competence protein ComEA